MQIDFSTEPSSAYACMVSAIGPRPIAWVSTCSRDGVGNLASFSFFQMVTGSPPTLMISSLLQANGNINDATRNIMAIGEFVVNLVSFPLVGKMNEASFTYPSEASQIERCGITTLAAKRVRPARVAGVPVSFECRLASIQAYPEMRPSCHIILGEVMIAHIDDSVFDEHGNIDPMRLDLVSRMGGDWYGRTRSETNFTLQPPVVRDRPLARPDVSQSTQQLFQEALAHHQVGRLQQAELSYQKILGASPDHSDALSFLGLLMQQIGNGRSAYELTNRAIGINPRNSVYYRNFGNVLRGAGRLDAAAAAFRKAVALSEHFPEALCDLGDCLREQGKPGEAETHYRQALLLKADFVEACINLALAQKEQSKLVEAEASIRHAVKIGPNFPAAHNNLGVMLQEQGKFVEAEAACRRALQLAPDYAAAHYNLSNTLRDLGRVEEAEAGCRRVIELEPHHAEAHFLLAFLLLLQGQYREGWQCYESRWSLGGQEIRPDFVEPLWNGGADLFGKTILLYAEQGYGDVLQFVRYARLLAGRGATVYLAAPLPLKSLLERCTGVAGVVSGEESMPIFDYQCPLMSLPLACNTELNTIPAETPYLTSDPARVAEWAAILGAKIRLRVGLVWAGNSRKHLPTAHAVDRLRSVRFEQLRPLLGVAGVEFFSLQLGDEPMAQLKDAPEVKDFAERLHDFHDTAALIENLDLVISVDTSVAHLAGAIGKPVWLLNRFNTCWRWLIDRSDSPWYPTMRIFRQPRQGDWANVIDQVKIALTEHAEVAPSQRLQTQTTHAKLPTPGQDTDSVSRLSPMLQLAVSHHQTGRLAQADALYREILKADPDEPDALHFLGMLMHQSGDNDGALEMIGRAIAVAPRNPLFHCNYGTVQRRLGKLQSSIDSYLRALALKEDYADAHYKLGVSLQQAGRSIDAEVSYRRALELRPEFADTCFDLGNLLRDVGKFSEAEAYYRRALLINPKFAKAYSNLGVMLATLNRFSEAEAAYRRALELKPDFAEIHNNLGFALYRQNRFAEAEASCRLALQIKPDLAEAHNNLGIALKDQGFLAAAEASYRRALEFNPRIAETHSNLGNILKDTGRFAEAEACFRLALQIDPDYAEAHLNYAFLLLQGGEFSSGWLEYEYRWTTRDRESAPEFTQPLWLGEVELRDKAILLHAEQGFGDTLQFVRYAKMLAARGATVYLAAPAPLKALLARSPGVTAVFCGGEALPSFDYHCPLLSLPLACKTELATIPGETPYLAADAAEVRRWGRKLGEKKALRVGLAWAGSPRLHQLSARSIDMQRSIHFNRLRPMLEIPAVEFFSLQLGDEASAQIKDVPQVKDYTAELHDFQDTAALIENLDLVISVDTSVVHLAGAIGKPVWMLNRYNTCWRWLNHRSDSPWYPTLRIFRQASLGEWDSAIAEVKAALHALVQDSIK